LWTMKPRRGAETGYKGSPEHSPGQTGQQF
jgi:hypothetical protein